MIIFRCKDSIHFQVFLNRLLLWKKWDIIILHTMTKGGRQKGSSPLASYSSCSKATNLLGRWSPYDGAFKCVHLIFFTTLQRFHNKIWAFFNMFLPPPISEGVSQTEKQKASSHLVQVQALYTTNDGTNQRQQQLSWRPQL